MAVVTGSAGNDVGANALTGTQDADTITGLGGNDELFGLGGDDSLDGGTGNDTISGGAGMDTAVFNVTTDGADSVDLGADSDIVNVTANGATNVRLTFTSAEVGNGNANDSNTMANQDGGLAVRLQAEDGMGMPAGSLSRFDDEGITFVGGAGVTFDVRDLVSGVARGELFEVVALGTSGGDTMTAVAANRPYYFNGGQGADTITDGTANDFLVGGAGNDTLTASAGMDRFIGGGGNDTIFGGEDDDTVAAFNVTTDGSDSVDLGTGNDVFNVSATAATNVRLTFTSAEVGNGNANDSNMMANQDGGLAVRLQAENGMGGLTGGVTRVDDEGITFVGAAGVTFDVRDLVSGIARGDQFEVVALGTSAADTMTAVDANRPYYFNGGQGADTITDGTANDFLVGGAGNDTLTASAGRDSFIGGGGNDTIFGGEDDDTIAAFNVTTDGSDSVDLGTGNDVFNVSATAATNVRLTFTSAEVGNGSATDSNTMANQDGGLAVRLQAENGMGALTGGVTRVDDEGITFVGGAGVTFDVRDLVSGVARGDQFQAVALGTSASEMMTAVLPLRPYYFNGGMGNDTIRGGLAEDFLVGGAGADFLAGEGGIDTFLGGGGDDIFVVNDAAEVIIEGAGQGTADKAFSSVSYTLGAQAQVEQLSTNFGAGTEALNLTGNNFAQLIIGNNGANRLDGRGGADTLQGNNGDDIYVVDNAGDVVIERAGQGSNDQVYTSVSYVLTANSTVESLSTNNFLGTDAIALTGNQFGQKITGNSGDNVIDGGAGNDTLQGFVGDDIFVFSTNLGPDNIDRIVDYTVADDTIRLDSAVFSALSAGTLDANAFAIGSAAGDASDRIIYNASTGALLYDADGNGAAAARQFAVLSTGLALTSSEFVVV